MSTVLNFLRINTLKYKDYHFSTFKKMTSWKVETFLIILIFILDFNYSLTLNFDFNDIKQII